jgi:hypothetical protein
MLAVSAGPSSASSHTWTLLHPASSPSARAAMSTAYDPVNRKLVIFGGFLQDGTYLNETSMWDGAEWATPIGHPSPTPRAAAGLAYDRVTHQLVLFGGYDGATHLGDTWTWDATTLDWTHRQTATKPPGVSGPLLFTDPLTGRVDMVGGFDGRLYHNTTWQWTGANWRELDTPASLTGRGSAVAELDRANHTVVVFSGIGGLNVYDTWTWDGVTWTLQSPKHQPPSRFYSASAYSPALRSVVVFGGASPFGDLNDTWAWNGTDWRQLHAGPPPAKRESPAMAYDADSGQILMFGGQVNGNVAGDTWQL